MSTEIRIQPAEVADLPTITEIYNDAIATTTATFDTEPKRSKSDDSGWRHTTNGIRFWWPKWMAESSAGRV